MYHFMFGLRGASAVALPSALGGGVSGLPDPLSFLSSSNILRGKLVSFPRSAMRQVLEQVIDGAADGVIDDPEIKPKQKNSYDDHGRGGTHLFEGRRGDLLHLRPNIAIKGFDALGPGFYLAPDTLAADCCCHRLCHSLCFNSHQRFSLCNFWQGRRDSNPQVRFWRPAV
jgi:hypothetical protein